MDNDERIKALEATCAALEKRLAFAERRIAAVTKHGVGHPMMVSEIKRATNVWVKASAEFSGKSVDAVRSDFASDYAQPEDAFAALAKSFHDRPDDAFPAGANPADERRKQDASLAMVREYAPTWADIGFVP